MARWSLAAYGALVIVATVNREVTAILLVVSWLALQPSRWRYALVYAGLALVTHELVKHAVGDWQQNNYTLQHVWYLNTHSPHLLSKAVGYNLLLAPLWLALVSRWRAADVRLKRLTVALVLTYIPAFFLLGIWQETRLLMPMLVLALPIATRKTSIA